MAKITQAKIKEMAKENVLAMLNLNDIDSNEMVGNCEYAIPTEIDGQEIWVEIKLTCKNWYDTKTTKAYDPFEKQESYKFTLQERERKEQERKEKKAKKIAKSQKVESVKE